MKRKPIGQDIRKALNIMRHLCTGYTIKGRYRLTLPLFHEETLR